MLSKWYYRNKCVNCLDDTPECCPFIVYRIDFIDGTYYVGSKQLFSVRRVKLSKKRSKELYKGKGSYPKYEVKRTESDWKTYNSSSKTVQKRIENNEKPKFIILGFYETKQEMLLQEAFLITHSFIHRDKDILNEWVSVKAFKLK